MSNPATYIGEAETTWNSNTPSTKTTASFNTQSGDYLVVYGGASHSACTLGTPVDSNTELTFTLRQSVTTSNYSTAYIWTAPISTSRTGVTISVTRNSDTTEVWGFNAILFRGSQGIGASSKANTTGAPSLNITTQQDNSSVVMFNDDWNTIDGSSRTYRTTAGSFTELTYSRTSDRAAFYGGYYADVGTAGTKTVGISSPSGQKYSIIALEVLPKVDIYGNVSTSFAVAVTASGTASNSREVETTSNVAVTASGVRSAVTGVNTSTNFNVTASGEINAVQGVSAEAQFNVTASGFVTTSGGASVAINFDHTTAAQRVVIGSANANIHVGVTSAGVSFDPNSVYVPISSTGKLTINAEASPIVVRSGQITSLVPYEVAAIQAEAAPIYNGYPTVPKLWVRHTPFLSARGEYTDSYRPQPEEIQIDSGARFIARDEDWSTISGIWQPYQGGANYYFLGPQDSQPILSEVTYLSGKESITRKVFVISDGNFFIGEFNHGRDYFHTLTVSMAISPRASATSYPIMDWMNPTNTEALPDTDDRIAIVLTDKFDYYWGGTGGSVDPIASVSKYRPVCITLVINPPIVGMYVSYSPRHHFYTSKASQRDVGAVPLMFALGNGYMGPSDADFSIHEINMWSRPLTTDEALLTHRKYFATYGAYSDWS